MSKCICCGKNNGVTPHYDGGMVCNKCIGNYFTCPDCGRAFDVHDYDHGDAGDGFCKECSPNH